MTKSISVCFVLFSLFLISCKGPKGDTGPIGPTGSLVSTSSQNTYALKFLGSNGYVAVPYAPALQPEAVTVELWVYVDTLASEFTPLIAAADANERNTADGYGIKFESGYCYFRLAQASNVGTACAVIYTPPTRQWIHIAGTYSNYVATLYINGQQVGQSTDSSAIYYGTHSLTFGVGYHSDFGGYSFFHGMMDEIRVWNYARSSAQIQQSMSTKLAGSEQGLIGYWNFDNNELNPLALDATSNHDNGLIWGDAYFISTTPFQ